LPASLIFPGRKACRASSCSARACSGLTHKYLEELKKLGFDKHPSLFWPQRQQQEKGFYNFDTRMIVFIMGGFTFSEARDKCYKTFLSSFKDFVH
jgi:hypothetical protein